MKRQIRNKVFETNSSSTHVLCLASDNIDIKQDILNYDAKWSFHKIVEAIEDGNYDSLHEEVKDFLKSLDFDFNRAKEDRHYMFNFIDNFNFNSGCGGEISIDTEFYKELYDSYNAYVNISDKDFYDLLSDGSDVKTLVNLEIDDNKKLTIKYVNEKYNVIKRDSTLYENLEKIWSVIDRYDLLYYYKRQVEEFGAESVKQRELKFFEEIYEKRALEELKKQNASLKVNYPETYSYLKEVKVIE